MPALDPEALAEFNHLEHAVLTAHDHLLERWKIRFEAGATWEAASLETALNDLAVSRGALLEARRAYLVTAMDPEAARQLLGSHAYRARSLVNTLCALERMCDAVGPLNEALNDLVTALDQLPARSPRRSEHRNLRVI